MENDEEDISSY